MYPGVSRGLQPVGVSRSDRDMDWSDAELRAVLDPVPAAWPETPGGRRAAVIAPLVALAGEPHLLFVRRRPGLTHHAGQIAFPGGAREADEAPLACALREWEEETGTGRDQVTVLGALTPRASSAGYFVVPLVARAPLLHAAPAGSPEIEAVLAIPLAALADASRWELRDVPGRGRLPHFAIGAHALWGLTARFTRELLARLGRRASPGPGAT